MAMSSCAQLPAPCGLAVAHAQAGQRQSPPCLVDNRARVRAPHHTCWPAGCCACPCPARQAPAHLLRSLTGPMSILVGHEAYVCRSLHTCKRCTQHCVPRLQCILRTLMVFNSRTSRLADGSGGASVARCLCTTEDSKRRATLGRLLGLGCSRQVTTCTQSASAAALQGLHCCNQLLDHPVTAFIAYGRF